MPEPSLKPTFALTQVMGSVELSNPEKQHFLGSVSSAVSKEAFAHCMIVKKYATTQR